MSLVLAACGLPAVTSAPSGEAPPTATQAAGSADLPGSDEFVPDRIDGVTTWTPVTGLPNGFDANAAHAAPEDVAEALGTAMLAEFAATGQRPDLELTVVSRSDAHAVLLITETGIGDDSVAGSQYSLFVRLVREGWYLDELWMRALCRRGTADPSLCL